MSTKKHVGMLVLAVALSLTFVASGRAEEKSFASRTWVGSYHNSKDKKDRSSRIDFKGGKWEGYEIENLVVTGNVARWTHLKDDKYYEVTATKGGNGAIKVHYDVFDAKDAIILLGVVQGGPLPQLYSGDGAFYQQ